MAAPARTLINAVRPHIPSIKFRYGASNGGTVLADALLKPREATSSSTAAAPDSKLVGSTLKGSGIEYIELPSRYHRKPLTQEEMEYIQRGGPA
ncbi:alpha-ketoglutarate dehydrogenase component 4-like [Ylistrum balloti]|uniref:alpha-ketoglutarate dehydrogenase component 4-like n=1 Tax=Ylistrum balloti TaxID=509963 RepID=UPI002905D380|nr:alpha-ketoglutarate dehydrogenase component 4-like [Ylistrum balloti]